MYNMRKAEMQSKSKNSNTKKSKKKIKNRIGTLTETQLNTVAILLTYC